MFAFLHSIPRLRTVALAVALTVLSATTQAAQVNTLNVQFGTSVTLAQAGYTLLKYGSGTNPSTTYSSIGPVSLGNSPDSPTLTISAVAPGSIETRQRPDSGASSSNPDANLLSSFLFNDNASSAKDVGLSFSLTGLTANQEYTVDIFSYVKTIGNQPAKTQRNSIWTIDGSSTQTSYTMSSNQFSPDFLLKGISTATGTLTFKGLSAGAAGYSVLVNGFSVVATPEPSTLALAGCGLVGLGCFASVRRRRRK